MVPIRGKRVLLMAETSEAARGCALALAECGAYVLGPARTPAEALSLIANARPDAAVIDLEVAGRRASDIADALDRAGAAFVFVTDEGVAPAFELDDAPLLPKPPSAAALELALTAALAAGPWRGEAAAASPRIAAG